MRSPFILIGCNTIFTLKTLLYNYKKYSIFLSSNSMKKYLYTLLITFLCSIQLFAQRNNSESLAKEYFNKGEYDKAQSIYEKLYDKDFQNQEYYNKYFQSLIIQKKYTDAEKLAKRQIKKTNNYPAYYIDLGIVYDLQKDTEKAKKQYDEAIKRLQPNLMIVVEVCEKFTQANLYDEALRVIEKARRLTNNPALMSVDASKIYSLQNNKQGIIEEQLNLLEQNAFSAEEIQQTFQDYFNEAQDYEMLKVILLQKLQKSPDQIFYSELLIWTFIQQQNFEGALLHSLALDKRYNENGQRLYSLGLYCKSNKQFDVGIKCFKAIIDKGKTSNFYSPSRQLLLGTQKEKITTSVYSTQDLLNLENDYKNYFIDFGENSNTSDAMREYAELLAKYLNRANEAIVILQKIIDGRLGITSFISQCKLDLGDYYLFTGEIWEAALLYGQVDKAYKDEPLGQMAKFRNARLSYYAGEFDWAKAQLDILKASTSQLIANDALNLSLLISDNENVDTNQQALRLYANADLLVYQHQYAKAIQKADSIDLLFPNNDLDDDILWLKAGIELNQQNYTKAIDFYKQIIDKYKDGIWADDALFSTAEIYQNKIKNAEMAMKSYQQLIDDFPGSMYVVDARKRFRILRGS